MPLKHRNNKGLNERKSNQGEMNIPSEDRQVELDEKRFNVKDQEHVEEVSGEQGETQGDSFDKNPPYKIKKGNKEKESKNKK